MSSNIRAIQRLWACEGLEAADVMAAPAARPIVLPLSNAKPWQLDDANDRDIEVDCQSVTSSRQDARGPARPFQRHISLR